MPNIHHETANLFVGELSKDPRIAGVAAGGSWLAAMDEYSDLDQQNRFPLLQVIDVVKDSNVPLRIAQKGAERPVGPLLHHQIDGA